MRVAADTLALFDLDHTLIPFDSGMAWIRFLVGRGILSGEDEGRYLSYCEQYVAGTLDIHAMHRASLRPLLQYPRSVLAGWLRDFEREMALRIPASMLALVRRHQQAGDLCAIVTATTRLIAEPFARLFGIDQLVATEAASVDGSAQAALTGEIDGDPCYRAHKLTRVERWLALRPSGSPVRLADFAVTWFYSDSISDLPLLGVVSQPVAVRPDARLRAHALASGWPILDPG
jgi:HAD superfamily hydrolase (TIGR01490 family)